MSLRRAVAIEAEAHRVRFSMVDDLHLIDLTVAADTRNTAVDVRAVAEFYVVGCLVNFHPLNRLAVVEGMRFVHRAVQGFQFRAVPAHVLVAVPASVRRWQIRVVGIVHKRMTITAIKAELIDMDFVRKRNRLGGLIADHGRLWSGIHRESGDYANGSSSSAKCDFQR